MLILVTYSLDIDNNPLNWFHLRMPVVSMRIFLDLHYTKKSKKTKAKNFYIISKKLIKYFLRNHKKHAANSKTKKQTSYNEYTK